MASNQQLLVGVLLAVVVGAAVALGATGNIPGIQADTTGTDSSQDSDSGDIQFGEEASVEFSAYNALDQGTTVSGVTFDVYEATPEGERNPKATNGSSVSLKRGQDFIVHATKSGYISGVRDLGVPTDETVDTISIPMYERASLSEVLTVRNDDGAVNSDSDHYSIGTGQTETIKMEFQGVNNKKFPSGKMVFEVNDSEFSDVALGNLEMVDTPGQFSSGLTNGQTYTFDFPALEDTESQDYGLTLVAEDSVDPTEQALSAEFYDRDSGIDSKTGEFVRNAVEDSDDKDFGTGVMTTSVYIK